MDLEKKYFPTWLEQNANLLSIPELLNQLKGFKPETIIVEIIGGSDRHFPTSLKTLNCDDYEIYMNSWRDGTKHLNHYLKGGQFILFDEVGEKHSTIFYSERNPAENGNYGDAENIPPHMTVETFRQLLEPYNSNTCFFVKPLKKEGTYISPDMLMHYNNASYKIVNSNKEIVRRDIGMEGMACFGVGSTMEGVTLHVNPKNHEEKMIQEQNAIFKRFTK